MLSPLARLKTSHYASLSPDWAQLLTGSYVLLCWIEPFGARRISDIPESLFWARPRIPRTTVFITSLPVAAAWPRKKKETPAARGQSTTQGCDMMHRHKHTTHTHTHIEHVHTPNDTGTWWTISGFTHLFVFRAWSIWLCTNSPTHAQG